VVKGDVQECLHLRALQAGAIDVEVQRARDVKSESLTPVANERVALLQQRQTAVEGVFSGNGNHVDSLMASQISTPAMSVAGSCGDCERLDQAASGTRSVAEMWST
jgi:hypothetical protein